MNYGPHSPFTGLSCSPRVLDWLPFLSSRFASWSCLRGAEGEPGATPLSSSMCVCVCVVGGGIGHRCMVWWGGNLGGMWLERPMAHPGAVCRPVVPTGANFWVQPLPRNSEVELNSPRLCSSKTGGVYSKGKLSNELHLIFICSTKKSVNIIFWKLTKVRALKGI